MRPEGSAAELERRRRRAVELLRQGKGVREVARMVGASPGSVTVWRQAVEREGNAALAGWAAGRAVAGDAAAGGDGARVRQPPMDAQARGQAGPRPLRGRVRPL